MDFDRIHDLILDLVIIQQLYSENDQEFTRIQTLIEDLQLIVQLKAQTV
jgi:hypothetical protein